jgi:lysozyme family protein
MFTNAFNKAVEHVMLYEVGGWFKLTPDVELGLVNTTAQQQAVGYVNDPADHGGETKFGIAKHSNPSIDVKNLTWADAKQVYFDSYWTASRCPDLLPRYAVLHFDIAINHGARRAAIFLQRALGVADDGVLGPITIAKADAADPITLCGQVSDQRLRFYNEIVAHDPTQSRFFGGWARRCTEMRSFTTNPLNIF